MKQRIVVLAVLGMLPWAGLNAQKTATFRVTVKVEESCEVTAHGANLLRATCTPNATYYVGLNKSTLPQSATVTGVGTGRAVDHTLFGAVPAARIVPGGDYADFVAVHIYY